MALGSTFTPYTRQKPAAAPALGSNPMGQYQRRRQPAAPSFGLQAQQPLTQAGALAQQKTTQGLQTGNFAEVQSAQNAANRASALRQTQAIQLARGNAVRGNLSAEAAQRAQDESLAAAQSQNLSAQNAVNALQRQATADAMSRADIYERDAYSRAADERDYRTGRADLGYNRATDENRYQDSRGDVLYNRETDAARYADSRGDVMYGRGEDARRFDLTFGANRDDTMYARGRDTIGDQRYEREYADQRGDVQYNRGIDESRYADTRGDVLYGRQYQAGRDAIGDQRYTQEYADSRGDVQYGRDYQASRDRVGDARYDQQFAANRDDVMYSRGRDTIGDQRYAQEYADSRGDVLYGREYQASRDQVGDARYSQEYADTRGDIMYGRETDASRYQDARGDLAYSRQYQEGRDAVADTRYNDATAYSRGRDTVADQRYEREYADQRGDIQYARETDASRYQDSRGDITYARDEARRLEGKGDIENLISSVQDPRAQNLLRTVQAQGGDVRAMYQQMMDNGTIKEDYRSASPGTQAYQAAFDELKAMYPGRSDAEIQTMIQQDYETARTPLDSAVEEREKEAAFKRLAGGGVPSPEDLKYVGPVNPQAIPSKPEDVQAFLAGNNTGGWVKIGGTPYKVIGASNFGGGEGNDYTIMETESGQTVYKKADGTITDKKPGASLQGVTGWWG